MRVMPRPTSPMISAIILFHLVVFELAPLLKEQEE
jgi:hypothetical protein